MTVRMYLTAIALLRASKWRYLYVSQDCMAVDSEQTCVGGLSKQVNLASCARECPLDGIGIESWKVECASSSETLCHILWQNQMLGNN
jgi:hypothetical protein